ncbi:MAG: transcriptional regulator, IclR family [Marmoricola sp.]|jgi:IclR family pca regulon transcriptional regulator|nr:transcriptional regulator, IclR family [Marmoricola sp.]
MPEPADPGRGVHFVQSLERGFSVIRSFSAEQPALSLAEVARNSGLTRAAARRFLLTLVDLGYARLEGRLFSLTPRVLELGYAYLSSFSLTQVAEPHMEQLVSELHESCSISVLDGGDIIYIARIPTARIMTVAISVGTRFPAHATSMGRVLLAALDDDELDQYFESAVLVQHAPRTLVDTESLRAEIARVRRQGWSIVDQELEEGLRSVAVPIRDGSGRVAASANVSSHASRTPLATVRQQFLPALLKTAGQIEADLRIGTNRAPERA